MDPPGWLDELRLEPGPPYSAMGTRALDLDAWFVVDDHRARDLARKRELIAGRRDVVVAVAPGELGAAALDACAEVDELVASWLADRGLDADPPPPPGEHPLLRAALRVQDDLAVLQRVDGEWLLTAGVVCFPSAWTVADKVGLPLALVHSPVAHYERELRERVDRFHERLDPARPAWRRNWFAYPSDELHVPAGTRLARPARIELDGSPMWIRSERQTLRRLPATGAILFAIRTQQVPLGVLRGRPDLARKMRDALTSWDEPKRAYTSTGAAHDVLVDWLDGVAAGDVTGR